MHNATLRLEAAGTPRVVPVAVVELDRRSGVKHHLRFGQVELVDHVVVWVFEDGLVLAAVVRRSALVAGVMVTSQVLAPPRQAGLSDVERADVLHAAGVRPAAGPGCASVRWEVA